MNCDIISIGETHLHVENVLDINGYRWFGFNRGNIHVNAPKPSGGVGILVRNWLIDQFEITVIDKIYDGILGIKFKNRISDFEFIVFACYLPPECSNRGRDAQGFYTHLLTQIYLNSDSDALFVLGDLNSRIGKLNDILQDIDNIPNRIYIDNTVNQHGHELINFLNEANFCVLNGRFPDDNFTCISRKGKFVVDYICVPIDVFRMITNFKVATVHNIVEEFKLHKLIGEKSKLPDHSAITCVFNISDCCIVSDAERTGHRKNRFQLHRIPSNFMASELRRSALVATMDLIENSR